MRFNSFQQLGEAMGVKSKTPKSSRKTRKCSKCGGLMENLEGTNIWVCNRTYTEEEIKPDGTTNQVTRKCGNRIFV